MEMEVEHEQWPLEEAPRIDLVEPMMLDGMIAFPVLGGMLRERDPGLHRVEKEAWPPQMIVQVWLILHAMVWVHSHCGLEVSAAIPSSVYP